MRIGILAEEWFPVFCVNKAAANWDWVNKESIIEVDDDTLKRWGKIFSEFITLQKELAELTGNTFYDDGGFDLVDDVEEEKAAPPAKGE